MMLTLPKAMVSRDIVIASSRTLPSFPSVVNRILSTLDDVDAHFDVLVQAVNRDPVISARVVSLANTAALRGMRAAAVVDIASAISLIGITRLRHITLISSLNTFFNGVARQGLPSFYWQHSMAAGICCEELELYADAPASLSEALLAGLLHDIGQLWLHCVYPDQTQHCQIQARQGAVDIEQLEQESFGVHHGTIGAWLAEHWSLPAAVVAAIEGHHNPEKQVNNPLTALVHVAEVISNALDLVGSGGNKVTFLSSAACQLLGLTWTDDVRALFGRIEARASHANAFFADAP